MKNEAESKVEEKIREAGGAGLDTTNDEPPEDYGYESAKSDGVGHEYSANKAS